MMKLISNIIRSLAAVALISAGVIHTFPAIWAKWDYLVQTRPNLHFQIGMIAFILGIGNLIILLYYIIVEYLPKK